MTKTFISAGAGSGKTYRITTDVANMVKDGLLKPDQVIMTTFTKAAAQELREKAKKELTNLGLYKDAQQMEHALIGTVHSIAYTFLSKYWYLLGIAPDAAALEEDELNLYRDHSLRGLLNPDERKFLYDFTELYKISYSLEDHKSGNNYEFWKKDLCKVVDYIQWYGIDSRQLLKSLEVTDGFIKCLEPKADTFIQRYAQALIADIKDVLDNMRQSPKVKDEQARITKYTNREMTRDELEDLESIGKGRCKESVNYSSLSFSLADLRLCTKDNAENLKKYASLVFSLAQRWRMSYRQYKDEHHLIDFNDMEEMFLKLLGMEEVRQDIKTRFSHLYVDEFQDSSPMQVNIFNQLSSLLNTVYVGDRKQAIYGFRGADTDLTSAIADSISDTKHLDYSYRSVKPLVDFSNTVFSKVFSGMKDVKLEMPARNGNEDKVEHPLRLWVNDNNLAERIQQLNLQEGIAFKDIAVLARGNDELNQLAVKLRGLKIPVCRESENINDLRTGQLMKALLTLVDSPTNSLARAQVAYLTVPDYNLTRLIEERLDHQAAVDRKASDYLDDIPILKNLSQLRQFGSEQDSGYTTNLLGHQSISSLVESLVIELDLYALVQSWDNAQAEETNLQVFINLAREYESSSTKLAQPATTMGFIDYFTNQVQKGAANEDGVRLYTYHKAKGLEWKVVIMLSLDYDYGYPTNIATRCMLGCHNHREHKPTPQQPNPPMSISLIYNIFGKSEIAKEIVTARLQQHKLWDSVRDREIAEAARLLYVGVTRARNILILVGKENSNVVMLNWFKTVGAIGYNPVLGNDVYQDLFNIGMPFKIEKTLPTDNPVQPEPESKIVHVIKPSYSSLNNNLFVSPSKAGHTPHNIRVINDKENRMKVQYAEDQESLMGDFIHQVFCCCDDAITIEQIVRLRDSYGFTEKNLPEPQKVLDAWNYLVKTLVTLYGESVCRHHELPFRHFDENGHIVSGYMDFVWETKDSYIVVDYKTCPGNYSQVFDPTKEHFVGLHGDQLDCYKNALESENKKKVKASIIYYPVTQFVVEVI